MNSTMLPSFHFGMNYQRFAAARLKIMSEKIALLLHRHVDVPWLLHNLTFDGKLCLCDDKKNAAFV